MNQNSSNSNQDTDNTVYENSFSKYWKQILFVIFSLGLAIRLFLAPVDSPLALDSLIYFWYAMDTKTLGYFPENYGFPNTGWPEWLSLVFMIIPSSEILDYMYAQKITSIIISSITVFPIFFLARKFFGISISLFGSFLFIIEPHLVLNSHLGITEPIFILFVFTSIVFVLSENKKLTYIGFLFGGLSALVRYEGLLFLSILSVMFFITHKGDSKKIIKYILALSIFILILIPFTYLRVQNIQDDGLTSHIAAGVITPLKLTENEENQGISLLFFISDGLQNLVKYTGWIMIPYFIILAPIGFFIILKNKNSNSLIFIFSVIVLSIPALYAYSRGIQETRYLLILMPFFTIFSLYFIEKILMKKNRKLIILSITIFVIFSSIVYLDYNKIDSTYEKESYLISKQIGKLTMSVNEFYPESKYFKVAYIEDYQYPILSKEIPIIQTITIEEYSNLIDLIRENQKNNLTHLVIDNKPERKQFLKEIFNNETKYPFLIKVFDSRELNFKYSVKIFEIDYDKFQYLSHD